MQLRIMVVDDEPAALDVIKTITERLGCSVVATVDSRQAAQRLKDEKFDGVFLDIRMPAPDGFELAKLVRSSELNKSVPIVMFSGLDDVQSMREGFRAGATCFLGKPVNADRVASLVVAMRGAMMKERRRHARLTYQTGVDCRAGHRHLKLSSLNISESGMVLDASGGMEVGDEVDLEFMMPRVPAPVCVHAKVVYKDHSDSIGVEFLNLSKLDRDVIQGYIAGSLAA